jgi:dipeptidyl-peptidase-4
MAADTGDLPVSFPRLQARTARFTLGRPRGFTVSAQGERVVFLRSRAGDDRATCLWVYDVPTASERLVADPLELLAGASGAETPAERARRERAREHAAGIVAYSLDREATRAAFVLAGRLFMAELRPPDPDATQPDATQPDATQPDAAQPAGTKPIPTAGAVFDPRLDPTGRHIGYASNGSLRVTEVDDPDSDRLLMAEDGVAWGVAEFVAAEEMGRQRGFWWAPDGSGVLAARVDETPVQVWHIADPANPSLEPAVVRYPAAGTANADVSLSYLGLDGSRLDVEWDRAALPYLVSVRWPDGFAPLLTVSSRDQRTIQVHEIDVVTGATHLLREDTDAHWVELVPGVPDRLADGRLVWVAASADTHRLVIGSETVTPVGLQVTAVLAVSGADVLLSASAEPTEQHLWSVTTGGGETRCEPLTTDPGMHSGTRAGNVLVTASAALDRDGVRVAVSLGGQEIGDIGSLAEPAPFTPQVSISSQGQRELRTALVLPRRHDGSPLPVLMDPYGGPHALRVTSARGAFLNAQWLADQGFAVVIVDGSGTPGRGVAWEHEVAGDLATSVLQDQVDALHSLAAGRGELDLTRVAIRGWSFGGYLAALAVIRRPDVFHAAVAGAPVTDWRLYDTHYTERYLGVGGGRPPPRHPARRRPPTARARCCATRRNSSGR